MALIFKKPRIKLSKNSQETQQLLDKIESYLAGNSDEPAELLVSFWQAQAAAFTYKEIRKLILSGDVSESMIKQWRQDYSKLVKNHFEGIWSKAIEGGMSDNYMWEKAGTSMSSADDHVINWIRNHGAQLVTNCTDEQKDAIKVFLERSVRESMSTNELARLIRPCVGLTRPQAAANLNYYNTIKEQLKADHPKMQTAAVERKAREAALKYAEKQHRTRAETIARTELAHGYNYGNDAVMREAQSQGLMGRLKKRWKTSGDDKVCDTCRALEGVEIEMDETFEVKGKQVPLPPAHPRCACMAMYIEVD